MKKLYILLITSVFTLSAAKAVTINVDVAPGGSSTFSPNNFTAVVGDIVIWTLKDNSIPHTVSSITTPMSSVPAGANAINSGTMSTVGQTYSYTVQITGTYGYQCNFHGNLATFSGMIGGFSVAVGINEPVTNLITNAYPNPFNDKLIIKYNGVESIEVFNVVGEKIKELGLTPADNKAEIDFSNQPAGIYFYRTYKEGTVVETRKIVKAD